MAGHSKFANIKHRKEKMDAQKGKVFTRIGRELAVAVKAGGVDPAANGKLRDAVAKAKSLNMPNDTIERSIKKAAGDLSGVNYERIVYEGYGPSGVAVIVEALTDNKNRAAANVRSAFTKGGGNMGQTGCVGFLFTDMGVILVDKDEADEDVLTLLAIDAGAKDIVTSDEGYEIICEPLDFTALREAIEQAGVSVLNAELTKVPSVFAELDDEDDIKKMNKLLDMLDNEDDVTGVYHNWRQPDNGG